VVEEWKMPPISVGAWLRNRAIVQSAEDSKKMDDLGFGVYGELHFSGKVTPIVGYTINLMGGSGSVGGRGGGFGFEDAIVSFDFDKLFNVWIGQQLVPVDRTNFSGPFFLIPWNYPGVYGAGGAFSLVMPIEPVAGRDLGTVVWGDYDEGKFKYYLGAFADDPGKTVLFSGRLSTAPIGKDGGLWGNSTYYGSQNLLAFGVGAQYASKGSIQPGAMAGDPPADTDAYTEINADVVGELKVGDGALTGELAYYHFGGDFNATGVRDMTPNPAKDAFFVLGAYLSPPVGPGALQPHVRYQMATGDNDLSMSMIDVGVNYILKGPQMKVNLTYTHTDMDADLIGNALSFGVQTIMF